jgi:sugar lactone lactonase YvrE
MHRLALASLLALPLAAAAHPRLAFVQDFGPSLQADCPFPEGIALDPAGRVYASSLASAPTANICLLDPHGRLLRKIPVAAGPGGVAALLGMLFVPGEGLYVTDLADGTAPHGRLLHVDGRGRVTTVADGFAAPNAIARDDAGHLFVSDSFAGTVTRVRPDGSGKVVWAESPLLRTAGQPPFGANGLAFDAAQAFLYVANTGDDAVLRIAVQADGGAGPVQPFARGADLDARLGTSHSLDGADGIAFDVGGNLWVCANQANEIQVLSPEGELVARYRGAGADALDFPASLVFRGDLLFVSNLSLADGGVHSKLSLLRAPLPGLRLAP